MRTLRRNQQSMYYALQIGEVPIYSRDEEGNILYYEDDGGNKIPYETGEKEIIFSTPKPIMANISESGGESTAAEYGLSPEDYSAVLLIQKNAYPLIEGALIWANSEIEYQYGGQEVTYEIDGETVTTTAPIQTSADYMVKKVPRMPLNFANILLDAVVK